MSFSGKRYKRTRHENLEELLQVTNSIEDTVRFLQNKAPVFCFTRIEDDTFNFVLEMEGKHISFNFKLGEEKELEKRDGEKIKITFTMPSENVLNQVIKIRDGKVIKFSRVFTDNEAKMTVTVDGWNDRKATIYFEAIE